MTIQAAYVGDNDVLQSKAEAIRILGSSHSELYRQMADGCFPRGIAIGPRSVRWLSSELRAIRDARAAGLPANDMRLLVRDIYAARKTSERVDFRAWLTQRSEASGT